MLLLAWDEVRALAGEEGSDQQADDADDDGVSCALGMRALCACSGSASARGSRVLGRQDALYRGDRGRSA